MPNLHLAPGNHSHRYEKRFDRLVNDRSMRRSRSSRWLPILFILCVLTSFAAFSLPIRASAQDVRKYTDGPVTEEDYIEVQYGHFDEYIDWLNTTWKPTLEAIKKAGLVLDYKVFRATPKSPGQPNFILSITFKNGAAAFDNDTEIEDVTKQVIGSTEFQNKARAFRNEYRTVLGTEYVRELLLK